jgi:hypothetical protein
MLSRRIYRTLLLVGLMLLSPSPESAADPCFRGRPADECSCFWITEFSYSRRLGDLPVEWDVGDGRWLLTAEIGQMANLKQGRALGGSLFAGFDDRGSRVGVKLRGRRWISRVTAVDAGAGVLFAGHDNHYRPSFPAFTGHIGLMHGDLIGATVRLEVIPGKPKPEISTQPIGTDVAWYVGVTGGSYLGILVGTATLILAVIVLSTMELGYD